MRIYTRTGDDGSTGLFGGARIGKDDLRIEAYGTIDELNAWIGKIATHDAAEPWLALASHPKRTVHTGQPLGHHRPQQWAAKLPALDEDGAEGLESWMDELESGLPALSSFVLPGGHPAAADAHVARTVCRRAERRCVSLHRETKLDPVGVDLPQSTFGRLVHAWQVAHPCHGQPRHSLETQ